MVTKAAIAVIAASFFAFALPAIAEEEAVICVDISYAETTTPKATARACYDTQGTAYVSSPPVETRGHSP